MKREYDVVARATAYVNGNAVKSIIVTNPLVYSYRDRIVVTANASVNDTVIMVSAKHDSRAFTKELDMLRSLTNMASIQPTNARHNKKYRSHISALGLEDFESFLDPSGETPTLYMEIAIHSFAEAGKTRGKKLTNVSFRILANKPDSVKPKALTDWFKLEAKQEEPKPAKTQKVQSDAVSEVKAECSETKPECKCSCDAEYQNQWAAKENKVSDDFELLNAAMVSLGALATCAIDWENPKYYPRIKDVTMFAYHVNKIGAYAAVLDFNKSTILGIPLSDTEKNVISAYHLLTEFLTAMENKSMVDKDLFKIVAATCKTIGVGRLSNELYAPNMKS